MAISIALRGFDELQRSVTIMFLLMDYFLYQFSTFSEKMRKISQLEVLIFCGSLAFRSTASDASLRVKFCENAFDI